jgi:hypothetical protein
MSDLQWKLSEIERISKDKLKQLKMDISIKTQLALTLIRKMF